MLEVICAQGIGIATQQSEASQLPVCKHSLGIPVDNILFAFFTLPFLGEAGESRIGAAFGGAQPKYTSPARGRGSTGMPGVLLAALTGDIQDLAGLRGDTLEPMGASSTCNEVAEGAEPST
jgi:hypothetical protein